MNVHIEHLGHGARLFLDGRELHIEDLSVAWTAEGVARVRFTPGAQHSVEADLRGESDTEVRIDGKAVEAISFCPSVAGDRLRTTIEVYAHPLTFAIPEAAR